MKQHSDRELLELAAKGAGISIIPCTCGSEKWPFKHDEATTGKRGHWNPLVDDGDALRLAVTLGIVVNPKNRSVIAFFESHLIVEPKGDSPMEAVRRAIVRVAAAIGESMK